LSRRTWIIYKVLEIGSKGSSSITPSGSSGREVYCEERLMKEGEGKKEKSTYAEGRHKNKIRD
jgi:hypothetical protein